MFLKKQSIIFVVLIIFLVHINAASVNTTSKLSRPSRLEISKKKCNVPIKADPFDKTMLPFIRKKEPIKCTNSFYFAELDLAGLLKPNYSVMRERSCSCVWNALKILMRSEDKNQYVFKDFQTFNTTIDMNQLRKKANSDLVLVR